MEFTDGYHWFTQRVQIDKPQYDIISYVIDLYQGIWFDCAKWVVNRYIRSPEQISASEISAQYYTLNKEQLSNTDGLSSWMLQNVIQRASYYIVQNIKQCSRLNKGKLVTVTQLKKYVAKHVPFAGICPFNPNDPDIRFQVSSTASTMIPGQRLLKIPKLFKIVIGVPSGFPDGTRIVQYRISRECITQTKPRSLLFYLRVAMLLRIPAIDPDGYWHLIRREYINEQ